MGEGRRGGAGRVSKALLPIDYLQGIENGVLTCVDCYELSAVEWLVLELGQDRLL